jgi:hypothetical protein
MNIWNLCSCLLVLANPVQQDPFEKVAKEFAERRPAEVWIYPLPKIQTDTASRIAIDAGSRTIKMIQQALVDYSNIPEVGEMRKEFGDRFAVRFHPRVNDSIMIIQKNDQLLTIYGKPQLDDPLLEQGYLSYTLGRRDLITPGIQWSDPRWFSAVHLHELYHAWLDRKIGLKTNDPLDLIIDQELAATRIEGEVLNQGTGGQYRTTLEKILHTRNKGSTEKTLAAISIDDLEEIDRLFVKGSRFETNFRTAVYKIDLIRVYLEKRYRGAELQRKLRAEYERAFVN